MIKKLLSSVLAALMFLSAPLFAYADDSVSAKIAVDAATGLAELSGKASGLVSITVVPEDVAFSDAASELEKCIYFSLVESKNGEFNHKFAIPNEAEAGKYLVHIVSSADSASCSFNKIAYLDSSALAPLNGLQSASDLKAAAEALSTELGIDMSDENYSAYSSDAYKYVYALKKNYSSTSEFYTDYTAAYALSTVVNSADMSSALNANASLLGIDYLDDFSDDERLTEKSRNNLLSLIDEFSWEGALKDDIATSFAKRFAVLKAVSAVQTSSTRVQIQKAICQDFADVFDFVSDNDTYKKLKNPDNVFGYMLKDSHNDFNSIKSSFENAVDSVYDDENPPRKNNSGGGGSVGISSSAVSPVIPPQNDNKADVAFSDVDKAFWGYTAISGLVSKAIIKGYEDGSFRPDEIITRAEFTKLVVSVFDALGGSATQTAVDFTDVSANAWYAPYVSKASAAGLVYGSDGFFNPDGAIKREDACTILYRMLAKLGNSYNTKKNFTDGDSISTYAIDAVSLLCGADIVKGFEDGTFRPLDSITRAQASQLIYNITK